MSVNPGGISSTWWVTSTIAGASRSSASSWSRSTRSSRPPQVEPRGRLVEQHQLGVGHQRPRDLDPLALALATACRSDGRPGGRRPAPEQVCRAGLVHRVVVLAPAADDAVGGGDHDVADPLVVGDPVGQRGAGHADPGSQLEDVDGAEHLPQHPRHPCRRVHPARRPAAAVWSCRRRWGRARPTARPPRPTSRRPPAAGCRRGSRRRRRIPGHRSCRARVVVRPRPTITAWASSRRACAWRYGAARRWPGSCRWTRCGPGRCPTSTRSRASPRHCRSGPTWASGWSWWRCRDPVTSAGCPRGRASSPRQRWTPRRRCSCPRSVVPWSPS